MAALLHAGLAMASVLASLPDATTDRMPRARAVAMATASASLLHALVNAPPPKLMFSATMLYLALFSMAQLIAARMVLVTALVPSNTSSAAILAPGATASTVPATLVPCARASSGVLSSLAKSAAKVTLQLPPAALQSNGARLKSVPVSSTATVVPVPSLPAAAAAG